MYKYSIIPILFFLASCSTSKKTQTKTYEHKDSTVHDSSAQISKVVKDTIALKKVVESDESTVSLEFFGNDSMPKIIYATDSIVNGKSYYNGGISTDNDYKGEEIRITPTSNGGVKITGNLKNLKAANVKNLHTKANTDSNSFHSIDTTAKIQVHDAGLHDEKKETVTTKKRTSLFSMWWLMLLVLVPVGYFLNKKYRWV